MTSADRGALLEKLAAAERRFLTCMDNVSPEAWTQRPAPGQWSIAQCAEHIVRTEVSIFRRLERQLRAAPVTSAPATSPDQQLMFALESRFTRVKASPQSEPLGETGKAAVLQQFQAIHNEVAEFVGASESNLRAYVHDHAHLGTLDGHQWLLFIASHCERHIQQIEEVKQSLGQPE